MSDVNELLEQAIKETENLNEGEVFLVKDLFKGVQLVNKCRQNCFKFIGLTPINVKIWVM